MDKALSGKFLKYLIITLQNSKLLKDIKDNHQKQSTPNKIKSWNKCQEAKALLKLNNFIRLMRKLKDHQKILTVFEVAKQKEKLKLIKKIKINNVRKIKW